MNTITTKPHPLAYKTFRCPAGASVKNVVKKDKLYPYVSLSIKATQRSKYDPHVGKKQISKS